MLQISRPRATTLVAVILLVAATFMPGPGFCATPEKPYADLQANDVLTSTWLMGTINTIYLWAQNASTSLELHVNNYNAHVASGSLVHGRTSTLVGISDTQTLTNKSISGEQVNSGTVADARIASTLARDSEVTSAVSTHAALTVTHGATGAVVGTTNTQTLTNKSISGEQINSGTIAEARIDAAICRDSELTTHSNLTAAHGATGAVMGTTNTQTVTNKAMGTGCTWGGTAVPVANGGTGATSAATALTNLGLTSTAAELNKLDGVTATTAEINYIGGVTSAIQTQFAGKAASSHTHGNITNAGAIGTTATLPIITTTSGVLTAGSFGTAAGTFCQGNDGRLSDARTPTAHTHSYAGSASAGGNANTANAIRTSAPGSPADGDIWLE